MKTATLKATPSSASLPFSRERLPSKLETPATSAAALAAEFNSLGGALILAAHPDDESIGAAALISHLHSPVVVYVTDGAPRNLHDARHFGFPNVVQYARARAAEARRALALLGVDPNCVRSFGIPDQDSSRDLAFLARRIREEIAALRPGVILTHSYEGGHPDHDATAFAVHAALRLLAKNRAAPQLIEFTSYHAVDGTRALGEFIPQATIWSARVPLSPLERALKRRVLQIYETQQYVTSAFPVEEESFRSAPAYSFTLPPHPGKLYYEKLNWEWHGKIWRERARDALARLGLRGPL